MIKYENECLGCISMGLYCIGSSCRNRNVPHFYCDECGEEEELYEFDGMQLCISCIRRRLEPVAL